MRQEISDIIRNSGLKSESQILEGWKNSLRDDHGLTELELDDYPLTETDIQKLKHQIDLNFKSITDEEIGEIASMIVECKPLTRQIFLSCNQLTDQGIAQLCTIVKNLNHLNYMGLASNRITEKGFYTIFRFIEEKPGLDTSLAGNQIDEAGKINHIMWQAHCDHKQSKIRPEILKIINESGLQSDEEIIQIWNDNIKFLSSDFDTLIDQEEIENLRHQINLMNKSITAHEIEDISQIIVISKPHTRQIFLSNNQLADQGVCKLCKQLIHLDHLNTLDLSSNQIGEEGFYAIFRLVAQKSKIQLSLAGNLINNAGDVHKIEQKALFDHKNNHQ